MPQLGYTKPNEVGRSTFRRWDIVVGSSSSFRDGRIDSRLMLAGAFDSFLL
jgi:hypothetical protein